MKKATSQIVTANKELIDELLSKNTHNRPAKGSHVKYLREQIRAGNWTLTNQGIGVSVGGWIVDGGHRLEAIRAEGYPPVEFILVRNLPDDAQKHVDTHAKRSMSDVLQLVFDENISRTSVSCVNIILTVFKKMKAPKASPEEMIAGFETYAGSMRKVVEIPNAKKLAASVLGAIVHAYHVIQDERILDFTRQVISGEMIKAGDPAFALKSWLDSSRHNAGQGMQVERFRKTLFAIDCLLENVPTRRLLAEIPERFKREAAE
jgi:hypothetical protein